MHLLVLCANVGTQHYNLHSRVLAVARAWPGPAAVVACVQDGRRHVSWRTGQRACAGRVGSWAHHCVFRMEEKEKGRKRKTLAEGAKGWARRGSPPPSSFGTPEAVVLLAE